MKLFLGEEFEKHLMPYLISGLRKGVPSLFQNLVPLYSYPAKVNLNSLYLLSAVIGEHYRQHINEFC